MHRFARKWFLGFGVAGYLISAAPAFAYTQCTITLSSVYAGDGGNVWLTYTNGGSAYITPSNRHGDDCARWHASDDRAVHNGRCGVHVDLEE